MSQRFSEEEFEATGGIVAFSICAICSMHSVQLLVTLPLSKWRQVVELLH
jgi:hypothetical protein